MFLGLGSLVGLVALSSCSSIDKPAASVNGVEIPMDSFESDLAAVQTGLGPAPSDDPATSTPTSLVTADGSLARNLLTAQIQLELLDGEIERAGGSITDADRAEAESQLAQTQAGWDTSPERFRRSSPSTSPPRPPSAASPPRPRRTSPRTTRTASRRPASPA